MLTDPACVDPNKEAKRKKQKTSMSMGEGRFEVFDSSKSTVFLFSILLFWR